MPWRPCPSHVSRPPWGNSWHTANNAILTRAEQTITGNPHRFDGVEVLGVDDSPARFAPVREVPVTLLVVPGGRCRGLGQLLWARVSCPCP